VIATRRLPLPALPAHERGWANVSLLLVVTDLDVSALDGTRPRPPTRGDRSTRSGLRRRGRSTVRHPPVSSLDVSLRSEDTFATTGARLDQRDVAGDLARPTLRLTCVYPPALDYSGTCTTYRYVQGLVGPPAGPWQVTCRHLAVQGRDFLARAWLR
jgi:hypothetical protein